MTNTLLQGTAEWLQARKTRIGASDAPIIMGVSPYKTPFRLWQEKMDIEESRTLPHMLRGQQMEAEARECFERKTGIKMFTKVVFHADNDWMMASLDGIDEEGTRIVEIKCSGKKDHNTTKRGKIPDHYYPQIQHQLACTGLPRAFYFSYDGLDGEILEIERDDAYIGEMIKKERVFYECMLQMIPPDLSDKDYVPNTTETLRRLADQWKNLQVVRKQVDFDEKLLKSEMIKVADGKNIEGFGVRIKHVKRMGTIDFLKIPELADVDLEHYRRSGSMYWKIL